MASATWQAIRTASACFLARAVFAAPTAVTSAANGHSASLGCYQTPTHSVEPISRLVYVKASAQKRENAFNYAHAQCVRRGGGEVASRDRSRRVEGEGVGITSAYFDLARYMSFDRAKFSSN